LKSRAKLESSFSFYSYQALRSRHFQCGFHRVDLHRPTEVDGRGPSSDPEPGEGGPRAAGVTASALEVVAALAVEVAAAAVALAMAAVVALAAVAVLAAVVAVAVAAVVVAAAAAAVVSWTGKASFTDSFPPALACCCRCGGGGGCTGTPCCCCCVVAAAVAATSLDIAAQAEIDSKT